MRPFDKLLQPLANTVSLRLLFRGAGDDVVAVDDAAARRRRGGVCRLPASYWGPVPVACDGCFVARDLSAMQRLLWAAASVVLRQGPTTALPPRLRQVRGVTRCLVLYRGWSNVVKCCQDHFGCDLPSVSWSKRVKKFEGKFRACNNILCNVLWNVNMQRMKCKDSELL